MDQRSKMMKEENIKSLLFKLSLPATIGMVVNALYNLVDTIFIGQGVGADAIGGLAIAFPIQMLIMALAQLIGLGAASAVSRRLGAGDVEEADNIAGNAYFSVVIASALFAVFGLMFTEPILKVFGATPTLLPYAKEYIQIIFIGSIALSFTMVATNLIRSEGNAKVPMYSMILGTGLNIILDPIFIFIFDMGISGAALATVISQFVSLVYVVVYIYSGKSSLKVMPHHLKPRLDLMKEIVTVGMPSFARQVAGSFLAIIVNNSLGFYGGDIAITAYGVINRVMMFIFMPMFGVVQGMQPIAGFSYGAKLFDRAKEVIMLSIKALLVYATAGWLLCQLFPAQIMHIFTNDSNVIQVGMTALRIIVLALPFVGVQIISSSVFQSFGKARPALILALLRQIILLIPLLLILPKIGGLGLLGIWLAFPLSDFISTIISVFLLKKEFNEFELAEQKA